MNVAELKTDREKRIWLRRKLTPLPEPPDDKDFLSADGRCICEICGFEYRLHPSDEYIEWAYVPWLNVLCDGTRVKL